MSKQRESKLDQYAAALLEMDDAKKTLREMQAWLKEEGTVAGENTISRFLESLRRERSQRELLTQISEGGNQCQAVENAFKKNPAPELETLIKLHRVLILDLSTKGTLKPELLCLANNLTNTVLQFISGQTKASFKEREVTLAEQKAADAKKDEQTKALEFCLEEAKSHPAVQEQFRVAFAALKKAKAK